MTDEFIISLAQRILQEEGLDPTFHNVCIALWLINEHKSAFYSGTNLESRLRYVIAEGMGKKNGKKKDSETIFS